jgi:hypothetical protein
MQLAVKWPGVQDAAHRLSLRSNHAVSRRNGNRLDASLLAAICVPLCVQVPRVALTEMGPQLDCVLRRTRLPPVDLEKEALKQPKLTKKKVGVAWRGCVSCFGTFVLRGVGILAGRKALFQVLLALAASGLVPLASLDAVA